MPHFSAGPLCRTVFRHLAGFRPPFAVPLSVFPSHPNGWFCNMVAFSYFCRMFRKLNWDALGITTSIACAIHCAILPLVTATLPVLGVNIIHNTGFEYGMIVLALAIGGRALLHGYRLHHGRRLPVLLFAAGIAFLLAKQHWRQYELQLLPFAILLIGLAHIANFRYSRRFPGFSRF